MEAQICLLSLISVLTAMLTPPLTAPMVTSMLSVTVTPMDQPTVLQVDDRVALMLLQDWVLAQSTSLPVGAQPS